MTEPLKPGSMQRNASYPWPDSVKRRIEALKKLQLKTIRIEAKFHEEVHALKCRYQELYAIYYKRRSKIISGTYEPTEKECVWESKNEKKICEALKSKVEFSQILNESGHKKDKNGADDEDVKGIPDFWLMTFKNYKFFHESIEEYDEPILKHMTDFKVQLLENDPRGFVLEFHFSPNEYFSNSVLILEFRTKCNPKKKSPFNSEASRIYEWNGCTIDWKEGKNVIEAHYKRSFFSYFTTVGIEQEIFDAETIMRKIAHRAVLYYTGMLDRKSKYDKYPRYPFGCYKDDVMYYKDNRKFYDWLFDYDIKKKY